jgi:hypothetical protein
MAIPTLTGKFDESRKEIYDSNSFLQSFINTYVINNSFTKTPFRLKVSLTKKGEPCTLRSDIDSYYYEAPHFNIGALGLLIHSGQKYSKMGGGVTSRFNKLKIHYILSPNSLITGKILNILDNYGNGNSLGNYNQHWFREEKLDLETDLKKGEFAIVLYWTVQWGEGTDLAYSTDEQTHLSQLRGFSN